MYSATGLLEQLSAPEVRYAQIVAPAGYGKSALVRAFAELHASMPIEYYDCREISDVAAVARRVAGDTLVPAATDQPEAVLDGWAGRCEGTTHVFDHLESILGDPELMAFLDGLLRRLAPGSRAMLLSRLPLPISLTSDAAPHEIVAIDARDLKFRPDTLRREFGDSSLSEGSYAEIMRVTRGWPAAVLFLRRLIRNEADTAILLDLTASTLRTFHEYVLHEVIEPLSAADFETLVACAIVPHASFDDVAAALGIESAETRLGALVAAFPLIGYHPNATIAVHPLVVATLKAKHGAWLDRSAARAIEAHTERGAPVAAARMYLELGRLDHAADALDRAQLDFQSTQQTFEELAARLDDTVVCASPVLWNIMFAFRRYRHDPRVLLLEAERLLSDSHLRKMSALEAALSASMALSLCEVGEFDHALALCEALELRAAEHGIDVDAYSKVTQAIVMSHKGRFSEALGLWQRAGLSTNFNAFPISRQLKLEALAARARGQFEIESELHRRHLSVARRSGTAAFEAMALAEAAFSAWLAGRDDLMHEYAAKYRYDVPRALGYCYNDFFRNVSSGPADTYAIAGPLPRVNAYGALIRAGLAAGAEAKVQYALAAKANADRCNESLLRVLARVTLAFVDPGVRTANLQEALEIARTIESRELIAALEALTANPMAHGGMLEALVRRHRLAPLKCAHAPLSINILAGKVMRNGAAVAISEGPMALLVALALERKPASRERLCPLLWPDSEPQEAGNALKMCARRLRAQLDDYGVIDWSKAGYALRADTSVDILDLIPSVDAVLRRKMILQEEGATMRATFDALALGRPTFMTAWEWFRPTERRLCDMTHELGVPLARDAFERKDDADCARICRQLLVADPCDETAHELAIRLRMRCADRSAALREFRTYRVLLQRELGVAPSPEFVQLFEKLIA